MDRELYKRANLVLKTMSTRKGMGRKSSAIRLDESNSFKAKGYPTRPARQPGAHLANNRLEDTTKTTKPRDDTSGLCRIYNNKQKEQCMSPTALPQKSAVSLNPKLAFEALLTNAFKVREEIRQKTAVTMVTLDRLAMKASNQKNPKG